MKTIIGNYDYITGYLRYGHVEAQISDEEYEQFKELSEAEKKKWLRENGEIVVDDFSVDDHGEICDIKIQMHIK